MYALLFRRLVSHHNLNGFRVLGILLMQYSPVTWGRSLLEIEAHVRSAPHNGARARVVHVVIRIDTVHWKIVDPDYADRMSSIESPLSTLPLLQTVTLETIEEYEGIALVSKLPILNHGGTLRRRTCEQAQRIAQKALQRPVGYAGDPEVISPLWNSEEYNNSQRKAWCVPVCIP